MGEALLAGVVRGGQLGPDRIRCAVRRPERAEQLAAAYGVVAGTDPAEACRGADAVVVAVRPGQLDALLSQLAEAVEPDQTVISVAAGVPTARLEAALPAGTPVVRVMSNVAVAVGQAASVVAGGAHAGEADRELASALLAPVGQVVSLDEGHLDAVTAVSGSGPAYLFLVAEALVEAGLAQGLPRAEASELVAQTMTGAAAMLSGDGQSPGELRASVTSPAGTTIAGLRALEDAGVRAGVMAAVEAAARRAGELGGR
jgi:pyrroline-5-carboxylate reductase